MYFRFVVVAIFLVSLAIAGEIDTKQRCRCKKNEVFSTCGGCDGTCGDPHPHCDKRCHRGCFCIDGYVRDYSGICIPLLQCDLCPGSG